MYSESIKASSRSLFTQNNQIRLDIGEMNQQCKNCKSFFWQLEKLQRSSLTYPVFNLCCQNGRV